MCVIWQRHRTCQWDINSICYAALYLNLACCKDEAELKNPVLLVRHTGWYFKWINYNLINYNQQRWQNIQKELNINPYKPQLVYYVVVKEIYSDCRDSSPVWSTKYVSSCHKLLCRITLCCCHILSRSRYI